MNAFFEGPGPILRTVVVGILAYVAVVATLRISGKRTLAKLNAFDLIVTVALGSTLASTILSKSTPLLEGLAAFCTLVGVQWVVAWGSIRSEGFASLVRSEPTLLMRRDEVLAGALRKERVTRDELMTVVRQSGAHAPENVEAVILETDGSFSVIPREGKGNDPDFATAGLQQAGG